MSFSSQRSFRVTSREEGRFGQIRPSAMLSQLQDCAVLCFREMGKGRGRLISEYGVFWMLTRIRYTLLQPVRTGDELTVCTSHRLPRGAMLYLDHELRKNGEMIGRATAIWVLASVKEHQLLRLTAAGDLTATAGSDRTERLGHIRMPEGMTFAERRTVRYSELDINEHMNNTRYADYAMDALHGERLTAEQYVSSVTVNYEKELLCGETAEIFTGRYPEDDLYAVRGQDQGGIVRFDARIQVSPVGSLSDIPIDSSGKSEV